MDTGDFAMKENTAYGPVTSSQQLQDNIYAQPTESEYDAVKYLWKTYMWNVLE